MAGYNKIIIIGNLTRDPETKSVGGQTICKLNIASNRQYKNRQTGNLAQEVCFIDVDVWGSQAESCKLYLQKGKPALIDGRLKLDSWKDQEGNTRSKHSIVAERVVFLNGNQESNAIDNQMIDSLIEEENINSNGVFTGSKASLDNSRESVKKSNKGSFKDNPPFDEELPF
jgi:single-strand DNA-binding protein